MTRRLLVSWLSLALVVLVALEVPLAVSYARNQRNDALMRLENNAIAVRALAVDALRGTGGTTALAAVVRRYGDDAEGSIVVVDRKGAVVVGVAGTSASEAVSALGGHTVRSTARGQLRVAVPVASGGAVLGAVGISTSADTLNEQIVSFRWRLAAIAAGVLVVTFVAALLLARWVTRPLRRLETVAERVGEGELAARAADDDGPPEVRSLARRFNQTVEQLETLVRAQEAFVADASHQLRTPLTALQLRLENDDVAGALGEVGRLARIVDTLLALARSDTTAAETVDLAAAVSERVDAWRAVADAEHVRLEVDVRGTALVGRDRLGQVLDNLLANALAVAPAGSAVHVHGEAGALHVTDEGPGMSAEDRARAFDRFWSKGGGSGLGLPIVRRLVEGDGGAVELAPAAGGGLDVVLRLVGAR